MLIEPDDKCGASMRNADARLIVHEGKGGKAAAVVFGGKQLRHQPGAKKTFPSIVVTADDALAGFTEITTENQPQFVEAIATDLAATFSKEGKSSLLKKPTAVSLGSHLGVSWAAPGTAKVGGLSENLDRLLYAVVIGGRLYTVEVRAPKGKLDDTGRAAAKAVAIALTASGGGAVDGPPDPEAVPDA